MNDSQKTFLRVWFMGAVSSKNGNERRSFFMFERVVGTCVRGFNQLSLRRGGVFGLNYNPIIAPLLGNTI